MNSAQRQILEIIQRLHKETGEPVLRETIADVMDYTRISRRVSVTNNVKPLEDNGYVRAVILKAGRDGHWCKGYVPVEKECTHSLVTVHHGSLLNAVVCCGCDMVWNHVSGTVYQAEVKEAA